MNEPLKIVLIGNAVDGLEAHGPFSSDEAIDDFMNDMRNVHAEMELIVPPSWNPSLPPAQDEGGE
jgi:hypothetical protein